MRVVILCGGLGTRLREQTEFIPKPMVMIGDKPILWHIMKIYYHQGFREFVLPIGYKGEAIKEFFKNYKNYNITLYDNRFGNSSFFGENNSENWKINFIDTGIKTLTARRIYLIKGNLEGDDFMLTYGDGVADIDLKKLLEFHKKKKALVTITGYRPYHRFGLIEEKNGIVKGFKEKPQMSDYVNCGFMVFSKEALKYFTGKDVMLETDVLPKIAKTGRLAVYHHPGVWHYMDTQRDYEELNKIWEQDPKWKIW